VIRAIKAAWYAVLVLCAVGLIGVGIVQIFHGHDDPSRAGTGRLHNAFREPQPCDNNDSEICGYENAVKLDLPNGKTEVVHQDSLYNLVRREGPVTVQVEWIRDLHSATRVLYKDHWYRAAYPGEASIVESILELGGGILLLFYAGALLVDQVAPAREPALQQSHE
jgi:hypothetical protein